MAKHKDLQAWMDYFHMLRQYEQKGFLEVHDEEREVYITQAALHALTPGDNPQEQLDSSAVVATAFNIFVYAGWKSQDGGLYMKEPFALHVVRDDPPYDPLYTLFFRRNKKVDVINYCDHEK